MRVYKADLHIHSVLSPCGDLDMSPSKIVAQAKAKSLDIIAITDHNSTKHCEAVKKTGEKLDVFVLLGAEITTKEEIHCLTFFESFEKLNQMQDIIDKHLPAYKNDPRFFGEQIIVDEDENILNYEDRMLSAALELGIDELIDLTHQLNGLFVPAHINHHKNSLISQLGFIPDNMNCDAIEIYNRSSYESMLASQKNIDAYNVIRNSDAHYIDDVGKFSNELIIEEPSFKEIWQAMKGENGRKVKIQ